jgi:hypothetical protein
VKTCIEPDMTFGVPVTCSQRTMSAFQNQYARPEVCVARCRTVASPDGARSRGVSPSKPSSTWRSAKSGQYCATGASRSRVPRSICCSAATVATIFVMEAMRSGVSGVTGSSASARRGPAAPS